MRLGAGGLAFVLGLMACAGPGPGPGVTADNRYVNPVYQWSVSYPHDWGLDGRDPSFVKIQLPAGGPHGLVGIHSESIAPATSLDQYADAVLDRSNSALRRQGVRAEVLARRHIALPGGFPVVDVVQAMESNRRGKSRKMIAVEGDLGYVIDAETFLDAWPILEPGFARVIESFSVSASASRATIVLAAAVTLSQKHFKRPDPVELLRAAAGGLRQGLVSAGIDDHVVDLAGEDATTAFREFQAGFDRVVERAQGVVDQNRLQYVAAWAMAASLGDSHTRFLLPDEFRSFADRILGRPAYTGIGATSVRKAGRYYLWYVYPGGPAATAGLRAMDRVSRIDGASLDGVPEEQATQRLRGLDGTTVTLMVQRAGRAEPRGVAVVRQRVREPALTYATLDGGVGFIRLLALSQGAATDMERALDELGRLGIRGLVLDLRQNKGGLARELDRIASLLLPAGLTTYTHQASPGPHAAATVGGPRLPPTVPLVVLVDAETASNAEVLAAALRDHGRGVLLGTRTKGAAQLAELFRLPGGTGILVPTARMTTSLGVDLEGRGLTPDVTWDLSADDFDRGLDTQLQRAMEVLRERGMSRVPLPVSSGLARDCLAAGSC